MQRTDSISLLLSLCLALIAGSLPAQATGAAGGAICRMSDPSTDSEKECREAVFAEMRPNKNPTEDVAEDLVEARKAYLVGLKQSAARSKRLSMLPVANPATAAETSKTDFRSLFSLLVNSGSLTSSGETYKVDLGPAIGLPENVRLVANLRSPEVYEPLKMAIDAADLGDELESLEKDFDDFSDVSIEIKISPKSPNAPDPSQRLDALYQSMVAQDSRTIAAALEARSKARDALDDTLAALPATSFDAQGEIQASAMPLVLSAVESAARAEAAYLDALEAPLTEGKFFRYGELAGNDPQWVVGIEIVERDAAAGPDEVQGSASYEMSFPNLRGFDRRCAGEVDLVSCYDKLLIEAGPKAEKGNRMSFGVEYRDITTEAFSIPGTDVGIAAATDESLTIALSFGRNLAFDPAKGMATRRLELSADHEETDKASVRNSRQKASLTLTQRLTEETSLALGLVWASDPEFRDAAEKDISATFGLSYKLLEDEE